MDDNISDWEKLRRAAEGIEAGEKEGHIIAPVIHIIPNQHSPVPDYSISEEAMDEWQKTLLISQAKVIEESRKFNLVNRALNAYPNLREDHKEAKHKAYVAAHAYATDRGHCRLEETLEELAEEQNPEVTAYFELSNKLIKLGEQIKLGTVPDDGPPDAIISSLKRQ